MKLSVLICTRNRAQSLAATLQHFFAQRFGSGYTFEVIVVDNASTDDTRHVVERAAAHHPGLVRYCREPRPGLSFARNAGILAAQGDILAFTDDDVLVGETWLEEIQREFSRDPQLMMLGGRVLLAHETLQPVAIQPSEERQEFVFPFAGTFVMGANMAFRRELFAQLGGFDVRLGAGQFLAGAEDADFFYRALKVGHKLLYAPNVVVAHAHDRVTAEQAARLEYGYGKGCAGYLVKHALGADRYAIKMLYWLIYALPRRWQPLPQEPAAALQRRRAQIRGILRGLLAAPWLLLFARSETKLELPLYEARQNRRVA